MLLRRLETHGFKSFADKTELEFGPGITAIVGPNGSGKSNISDAIRWALGEQSIRTLRGAKMEDVIFAGSSKRRALGVAEVGLVFDNADGALALDYNEVIISRRVFRSGESEYYINKSPCRLKDIHELLADTGLGKDSMTVIGQNKVDELLNSKPEERRLIFEEAAGITKYKQRKKEALRKLDDAEQNLTRVRDLMSELENQLEPLRESAEKTQKYNALDNKLMACQVTMLCDRLGKAEKMVESARLEKENLEEKEIEANTRLVVCETEKEHFITEITELDQTASFWDEKIQRIATELERMAVRAALLEERIQQGEKDIRRFDDEAGELEKQRQETIHLINQFQEDIRRKKHLLAEQKRILDDQTEEYNTVQNRLQLTESHIAKGQEQTFGYLQEVVAEQNHLRITERDIEQELIRQKQLAKEAEGYQRQQQDVLQQEKDLAEERGQLQTRLTLISEDMENIRQDVAVVSQRLGEMEQQQRKTATELQGNESKIKILQNMQQEYEGFGHGIRSVLKSQASWRAGICGAVAQVLQVPDKFIVAVETALGGALQHVITDTEETAKHAVNFLKHNHLGRATFLPLNTVRPAKAKDFELSAAHAPGALGMASDIVGYEDRYRTIIEFLLGRTIVAENIDAALALARKNSFSLRIVTLEGEMLNPGGSLSGGSHRRKESSFLGRSNEIEACQKKNIELTQDLAKILSELNQQEEKLQSGKKQLVVLQEERQTLDIRLAEKNVYQEKIRLERTRLISSLHTLESEIALSVENQKQMESKIITIRERISQLESRDSEHKSQVNVWQQELREAQDKKEALQQVMMETKILLSNVQQEVLRLESDLTGATQRLSEQEQKNAGNQKEILIVKEQIVDWKTEHGQLDGQKQQLRSEKEQAEGEKQTALLAKGELLLRSQRTDIELRDLRKKVQDIQKRLHEANLIAAKYEYEITHCNEQLREQYGLDKDSAGPYILMDEAPRLLDQIQQLEIQIAELGPVNPSAIEEHQRANERHQFFQSQSQDLISAKEYLSGIIKDIDKSMEKQFMAAFQIINEYFGTIFEKLFGGGKASLELLEPDNILETGIDVIVQPPGKKMQNLALLSGGERAMTVIAILFSFLQYRPAPFCVVDEIDAALDEANVQRFSEFLRDYSGNTQFIVVTHRKGTMEVADVMHGVTMEEAGISRLISVKLMEKAG